MHADAKDAPYATPDSRNGGGATTMNAVTRDRYGEAHVLEFRRVDIPSVGDDEVLVRVAAAGLDRGVWHLMTGRPYLMRIVGFGVFAPKVHTLGHDLAGRVEAVGASVTRFQPGDEVFGVGVGAFAEYAVAKSERLALKPSNISFEEAAAIPTSAAAGRSALQVGALTAGQRVLIIGASGGVGSFAVQFARDLGAHVTGVASTSKLDMVRAAGADAVLDYTAGDITRTDEPYDLIVDIAGNRPLRELRKALTADGTIVVVGGENGGNILGGVQRAIFGSLLSRFRRQKTRMFFSDPGRDEIEALREAATAGTIRAVVDRSYPLAQAADAISFLVEGGPRGKVVIVP